MKVLKKYKKLFLFFAIIAVFLLFWAFDAIWASQYRVVVVDMPAETVMGDTLTIRVRAERGGKPQSGHLLAAVVVDGQGSFFAYRQETDENGEAEFTYMTIKESKYNPVKDIKVRIFDESNSLIVEVNAKVDITIKMISAKGG